MSTYLPCDFHVDFLNRGELIRTYFNLGFTYIEILAFLSQKHGIRLGLRQLCRILRSMGLKRKKTFIDFPAVIGAIEFELSHTGGTMGYRSMQSRLRNVHDVHVDRESVRLILRYLDPDGVNLRQQRRLYRRKYWSKGPDYLYHIDGWDKLKPFGLAVHGCIDGFSNNDPFYSCHYFCKCIEEIEGTPLGIRADRGTEDVNIKQLQNILRRTSGVISSHIPAFMYGRKSTSKSGSAYRMHTIL